MSLPRQKLLHFLGARCCFRLRKPRASMSALNLPADESLATTGTGMVGGGGRSGVEKPSYKLQLIEYVNSQFDGDRRRTCEVISRPTRVMLRVHAAHPAGCAPSMHPRATCRLLASCTRCSVDALVGRNPSGCSWRATSTW